MINSVHLCLIVVNTILTVIHVLKPSSLTHSLQIYCIGLTSPSFHISWTWAAKRVPTKSIFEKILLGIEKVVKTFSIFDKLFPKLISKTLF